MVETIVHAKDLAKPVDNPSDLKHNGYKYISENFVMSTCLTPIFLFL